MAGEITTTSLKCQYEKCTALKSDLCAMKIQILYTLIFIGRIINTNNKFLQEEELRASGDPKYVHLAEDLHVEITAFAAPAEAHARIAYALAEVRRYLVPDNNDDIRKEQVRFVSSSSFFVIFYLILSFYTLIYFKLCSTLYSIFNTIKKEFF